MTSRVKAEAVEPLSQSLLWRDLQELAKPRITLMVLITAAAGAYLAAPGTLSPLGLVETLVATGILASSASALNQVIESDADARMRRTAHRPIPSGRIERAPVAVAATISAMVATLWLAWRVNPLAAGLGLATWALYLFVYTPMKSRTPLATLVGAVPGALPPMMGWAAVTGRLEPGAWALFALLFCWQVPHFLGIAWMYRKDYERGGMPVLPVTDRQGGSTSLWMSVFAVATGAASLLAPGGGDSLPYLAVASILGLGYLGSCIGFARKRDLVAARGVLLASVVYLPVVLAAMILNRFHLA